MNRTSENRKFDNRTQFCPVCQTGRPVLGRSLYLTLSIANAANAGHSAATDICTDLTIFFLVHLTDLKKKCVAVNLKY